MRITKQWLSKTGACSEGIIWWTDKAIGNPVKCVKTLISEERLDWANWLICRVFNRKQTIQYAVFAAEQVIGDYERKYPDDKRPREAIEAAKKCIEKRNKKNIAAATAAAAAAAATAATAAAYAAATASAYAYAANAAAYAANAAAYAAAYAAKKKKLQIKILTYGLTLMTGGET
jgi:hypothetical protein